MNCFSKQEEKFSIRKLSVGVVSYLTSSWILAAVNTYGAEV